MDPGPGKRRTEELILSPFKWETLNGKASGDEDWDQILIWAHDLEDNPVLAVVSNFPFYMYFEFPETYEEIDRRDWNVNLAKHFYTKLARALKDDEDSLLPFEKSDFCYHFTLYYYQPEKRPMLKLKFKTYDAMKHAKNIIGGKVGLYFETDWPPLKGNVLLFEIDAVRKLLTDRNIKHCGWMKCQGKKVLDKDYKLAYSDREYWVDYRTIFPTDHAKIPRPVWCSYDIEVYSHNHKAFPRHFNAQDVIYLITVVFYRDGETSDKWITYAILSGQCIIEDKHVKETTTVITVKNESALIKKFCELVRKHDPDFLTGYNILQFDNKYIDARLKQKGKDEWPLLGRLRNRTGEIKYSSWSSSAYRHKELYIPYAPGRCTLDFYEQTTRNYFWSTYTLASAAENILADEPDKRKKDFPYEQQFATFKAMRMSLKAAKLSAKGNKKHHVSLIDDNSEQEEPNTLTLGTQSIKVSSRTSELEPPKKSLKGQPRDVDTVYRGESKAGLLFGAQTDVLRKMGELVVYGVYDSLLIGFMGNKIHWWIGVREMCNCVEVEPQELLTGGQQRRVLSMLFNAAYREGIILDSRNDFKPIYLEGGSVQKPKRGFSIRVATWDFNSLYPNIMIGNNLCYVTMIRPSEHKKYQKVPHISNDVNVADRDPDLGDDDIDVVKKKKKEDIVFESRTFRFVKPEVKKGILPSILGVLLGSRTGIRSGMKKMIEGCADWIVGNMQQLSMKVCSNSVYGFTGVPNGKRSCQEITAMVTYFGRGYINRSITWVEETYGFEMIYGDTDSFMMTMGDTPPDQCRAVALKIGKEVCLALGMPSTLRFELEGMYDMLCVLPKNYGKYTYHDGFKGTDPTTLKMGKDGFPELLVKGMAPARRDVCRWVQKAVIQIIHYIMNGYGFCECVCYLIRHVSRLFKGKISIDDLVITKGLSGSYNYEGATMKVFADEMAKAGRTISAGERHQFIVVDKGVKLSVGRRMMLLSLYESTDPDERYPLDYSYYFSLLETKVDNILAAEYEKYNRKLKKVHLTLRGRRVTAETPAKFLRQVINSGGSTSELQDNIRESFMKVGRKNKLPARLKNA
jgi:DNA polymerase elongation subunit (family B)